MHTTFVVRKDEIKFAYWWDRCPCLFCTKSWILGEKMLRDGWLIDILVSQSLVLRMALCITMKHKMAKICLKQCPKTLEILSSSQAKTYWPSFYKTQVSNSSRFFFLIERWHNPVQRCTNVIPSCLGWCRKILKVSVLHSETIVFLPKQTALLKTKQNHKTL